MKTLRQILTCAAALALFPLTYAQAAEPRQTDTRSDEEKEEVIYFDEKSDDDKTWGTKLHNVYVMLKHCKTIFLGRVEKKESIMACLYSYTVRVTHVYRGNVKEGDVVILRGKNEMGIPKSGKSYYFYFDDGVSEIMPSMPLYRYPNLEKAIEWIAAKHPELIKDTSLQKSDKKGS